MFGQQYDNDSETMGCKLIRSVSASSAQRQSSITGDNKDQASNSKGNSASISAHSGYTTKRSISDIREKYC